MGICSVLIIEDDESTRQLLAAAFRSRGYLTREAGTIQAGRQELQSCGADLIVLDRGLSDGDGLGLCTILRNEFRFRHIPILMLTRRSETDNKVLGLRLGADDYLPKPFVMEELLARADALLRHTLPSVVVRLARLEHKGIQIDLPARDVSVDGVMVRLNGMEYKLLRILLERAGTVLSRKFLLEAVWHSPPWKHGHKDSGRNSDESAQETRGQGRPYTLHKVRGLQTVLKPWPGHAALGNHSNLLHEYPGQGP